LHGNVYTFVKSSTVLLLKEDNNGYKWYCLRRFGTIRSGTGVQMFRRNLFSPSTVEEYTKLFLPAGIFSSSLFGLSDGGRIFLRNYIGLLPEYAFFQPAK
jgi:hypothetical protein